VALVVTDGRGTEMESRELVAGVDGSSGAGTGVDGGGDMGERQGAVEDTTFRDSDRGATRAGLSAMRMEVRGLG
jgi:hypothetical protein